MDDRTPAVDAWFARATAGLPEPLTGQPAHWMAIRLHDHRRALAQPAPLRGHRPASPTPATSPTSPLGSSASSRPPAA
ncbi:hypothetical protein [Streptomyces sp. B21-101]|uniref:hypothetical protein n=1 Tax=Streptomyces sp. B21-101 TaxID=3039415 RepID=UPI002FF1EFB3